MAIKLTDDQRTRLADTIGKADGVIADLRKLEAAGVAIGDRLTNALADQAKLRRIRDALSPNG